MIELDVPYVSQMVGGSGGNNCFSGCFASVLAHRGVIAPSEGAMLYVADIVRDGTPDGVGRTGGYTTWAMGFRAAAWFDQQAVWIDTWAGVRDSLAAGEPVIVLLDNTVLHPRQYPVSPAFNAHHFVLVRGIDEADPARSAEIPTNDPLRTYPPVGPGVYSGASLRRGVALVGGLQAMALAPWVDREDGEDVSQDGIISELNGQIARLREEVGVRTAERDARTAERDAARVAVGELLSTIAALQEDVEKPLRAEVKALKEGAAAAEVKLGVLSATIERLQRQAASVVVTIGDQTWSLPPEEGA